MSFRSTISAFSISLVMAGCSAAPDASDPVGVDSDTIVRGTVDTAHPQVLALMIPNTDGTETLCSATLYAKRTLVTAAHCLTKAAVVLAYHGNDYWGDFEQIFGDPTTWTRWAMATDWKLHPNWDPQTLNADIAVVHLDRALPYAPMPLDFRMPAAIPLNEKVEIVGFGGVASPDNQTAVDAYIKRKGTTRYVGSPAASPLPPNPHPGLGDKRIRAQLMKLDGAAPRANACFGDSGGPAFMSAGGRQRLSGVGSWVGDNCEQFSYYVRVSEFAGFLTKEAVGAMAY